MVAESSTGRHRAAAAARVEDPDPGTAPAPGPTYVQDLLRHLGHYGWPGAPRYLRDRDGREVLGRLDGHVAWEPAQPPPVWSEDSLVRVAKLVRQFHDLTAGTHLAGDQEVACHHDLAPRTTVYREEEAGLRPYAFVGWDHAGPGRRVHDVALVCWQFLDLGPRRASAAGPARLVALIADAYGLLPRDRADLVETILWWQDRCLRGLAASDAAGAGDEVAAAAVEDVRASYAWMAEHADQFAAAIAPARVLNAGTHARQA
ncbi:hypothetical protein SAMN05421678_12466 [Actinopolymorpha cephalotaxi]|uniref:Phosphotransferase enzyme family protein n=1 Tax=Actinopolymorpha cephalotaxi TaxID=504797 RepID=A0A1I3BJJ3_9ACTN|nr:trifolitoxin immunity protein [Actinopolymorpha cephalotaxi]NYH86416.1 hypothetical protein [Actinopolymorpha cephalotaxi]SFH62276.1 hypothetical protein SAMN05421678_12466 [Actinopolymorpha cephalotaxi]